MKRTRVCRILIVDKKTRNQSTVHRSFNVIGTNDASRDVPEPRFYPIKKIQSRQFLFPKMPNRTEPNRREKFLDLDFVLLLFLCVSF
jgi:hypothetical protein